MSNPIINRLGSNSIWYHFWYSDTMYSSQIHQDKIFSKLLEVYLSFGIETHHRHFSNTYWFKNLKKSYPASSYYRYLTMKKTAVSEEISYRLRVEMHDVYRMRTWILRYGKWLIINMYWFQPYKKRIVAQKIINKTERNYISSTNEAKSTCYRRLISLKSLTNIKNFLEIKKNDVYIF